MNKKQLIGHINKALDAGFNVASILAEVEEARCGKQSINGEYYFSIKEPRNPDDWSGLVVTIVHRDYWNKKHCVQDTHLSGDILLPDEFSEESESTFYFGGTIEQGKKLLQSAGFAFNKDLQKFAENHDPKD